MGGACGPRPASVLFKPSWDDPEVLAAEGAELSSSVAKPASSKRLSKVAFPVILRGAGFNGSEPELDPEELLLELALLLELDEEESDSIILCFGVDVSVLGAAGVVLHLSRTKKVWRGEILGCFLITRPAATNLASHYSEASTKSCQEKYLKYTPSIVVST